MEGCPATEYNSNDFKSSSCGSAEILLARTTTGPGEHRKKLLQGRGHRRGSGSTGLGSGFVSAGAMSRPKDDLPWLRLVVVAGSCIISCANTSPIRLFFCGEGEEQAFSEISDR